MVNIDQFEIYERAYNEQATENKFLRSELERYKQSESIRNEKSAQRRAGRGKHFTRLELTAGREMLKQLNASEERLLFRLFYFLEYQTNYVCERGQRLNLKRIERIAGLKKTHLLETIDSLEQKGVLFRIPDGRQTLLMVNAAYAFRGTEKDRKSWEQIPEVIAAKERCSELIRPLERTSENAVEPA